MNERLQRAVDRLMSCARVTTCSHEEDCFRVAKWASEQLNRAPAAAPESFPAEVGAADEQSL